MGADPRTDSSHLDSRFEISSWKWGIEESLCRYLKLLSVRGTGGCRQSVRVSSFSKFGSVMYGSGCRISLSQYVHCPIN